MSTVYLSMQEVKEAELRLLRIFDSYCRENNLRYSMGSGTLLGAVRHKGFIPWDDDIDVIMPVEDYRKFLAGFASRGGAEQSHIRLSSQLNPKVSAAIPFEKLVDTSIEVKSAFIAEGIREYVWIDIFPIVSFDSEAEANKAWDEAVRYKYLFQASRWSSGQPGLAGWIKTVLGTIARRTPLQQWALSKLRMMTDNCSFSTNGTAANLAWAVSQSLEVFPSSLFSDLVEYEFENEHFFGFRDADRYLSIMYGDYMTLPPADKRIAHELKAWRVNASSGFGSTSSGSTNE